jgi:hypothetical protein
VGEAQVRGAKRGCGVKTRYGSEARHSDKAWGVGKARGAKAKRVVRAAYLSAGRWGHGRGGSRQNSGRRQIWARYLMVRVQMGKWESVSSSVEVRNRC